MTGRRWTRVAALALFATGAGCEKLEESKPGPPVLVAFDVVDPAGMTVPLQADGGAVLVSPRAHVLALFDRLLDGDRLETATDAGVSGKAGIAAISANPTSGQPQTAIFYHPNGDANFRLLFAPGPRLMITPVPTLPAGATITVTLDKSQLVSKRGEGPCARGEGVADVLTFATAPFTATISAGDAGPPDGGGPIPLATDAPISVAFNNLPEAAIADRFSVLVSDGAGRPVANAAAPPASSQMDPAIWSVSPQGGSWPKGSQVTVVVDAAAKDALGMPIAASAMGTFAVAP